MKQHKRVFTAGVFDLFHIGHLKVLQSSSRLGEELIVGVSTDQLVEKYKGRAPVVPYEERFAIVDSVKFVTQVVPQDTLDKFLMWERYRFDAWTVGDDHQDDPTYQMYAGKLEMVGVRSYFLPYTKGVSSTIRRRKLG